MHAVIPLSSRLCISSLYFQVLKNDVTGKHHPFLQEVPYGNQQEQSEA